MRPLALLIVTLLAGCASVAPHESPPPPEYASIPLADREAGIEPPKVVHRVDPDYEPGQFAREARAKVGAIVNSQGRVEAVWLISGDPHWGRAVAEALRQWTFEPATKDGVPITVRFELTSRFRQGL